ncbi:MAG: hypothetical protein JXA24_02765 [Proteobacteria bacterium]|nr:hypothetical protein [Pseudomonadota bacterium]
MKQIPSAVAALVLAAIALVPARASAAPGCDRSIDVRVGLAARFVTLPEAPAYRAWGEGEICYELRGPGAEVLSESIPRLIFRERDLPGGLGEMTVFVDAMPGVNPAVSWEAFPEVVLSNVDLRVRAYQGAPDSDPSKARPVVDVVMSRLSFKTGLVEAEGLESFGSLDPETLSATLVSSAVLPDYHHPLYAEWLAGEPVLLELTVRVRNPYSKE